MIGPNVPMVEVVVNGTVVTTLMTGLNPYTQYSCYVTANTSAGEGSHSEIITAKTVEGGDFKCNPVCYYMYISYIESAIVKLQLYFF